MVLHFRSDAVRFAASASPPTVTCAVLCRFVHLHVADRPDGRPRNNRTGVRVGLLPLRILHPARIFP